MAVEELYGEKLALFQELGELSEQMAKITHEELMTDDASLETFQELLNKRATLMKEIDRLTKRINKEETEEDLGFREKLTDLANSIDQHNGVIEKRVKSALDDLREKSRRLQEGVQTNRAYLGRRQSGEGSFIDKRS